MKINDVVLSLIQSKLQTIVASYPNSNIVFNGETEFYDYDWIKKQINNDKGKDITPYTLVLENSQGNGEVETVITNQYAVAFLCKQDQRSEYDAVFSDLFSQLDGFLYADANKNVFTFKSIGNDSGVPFSEGSGRAIERYEQLMRFEVVIVNDIYLPRLTTIDFGSFSLPFRSFKVINGIAGYGMATANYADDSNLNMNKTTFIVEVFVNQTISPLITPNNKINYESYMTIDMGGGILFDDTVRYDGFEMSGEYNGLLTAFLYFTHKSSEIANKKITSIKLDGVSIPIVDYSITAKNITKTTTLPNSNLTKEIYVGKARAYAINVLKSVLAANQTLITKLYDNLLDDGGDISKQFLSLEIIAATKTYTKQVLLLDISEDSGNKGVFKISLGEGEII